MKRILRIAIKGSKGKLSSRLLSIIRSYSSKNSNYKGNLLITTFSPTLIKDNKINYLKELNYYKNLIIKMNQEDHIFYVSSQTVELTNITYYSKSKKDVEKLIMESGKSYTIVRPGMIIDEKENKYLLDTMNRASKSCISINEKVPKTSACTVGDIANLIDQISKDSKIYNNKIINLGLIKLKFYLLQEIVHRKKFRFGIITNFALRILGKINLRSKALSSGSAIADTANYGILSSIDKRFI